MRGVDSFGMAHRRYLLVIANTYCVPQRLSRVCFELGCPIHMPSYLSKGRTIIFFEINALKGADTIRYPSELITCIRKTHLVCTGVIEIIIAEEVLIRRQRDFILWGRKGSSEILVPFCGIRKGCQRPECTALVVRIARSQFDVVGSFCVGYIYEFNKWVKPR